MNNEIAGVTYWKQRAEEAIQRERAAGADMVAVANAAAAYLAAMTWSPSQDPKWKPGDGIIDYKTPEDRLKKLLKRPNRPGAALLAENAFLRQWLCSELTISDADIDAALPKE